MICDLAVENLHHSFLYLDEHEKQNLSISNGIHITDHAKEMSFDRARYSVFKDPNLALITQATILVEELFAQEENAIGGENA